MTNKAENPKRDTSKDITSVAVIISCGLFLIHIQALLLEELKSLFVPLKNLVYFCCWFCIFTSWSTFWLYFSAGCLRSGMLPCKMTFIYLFFIVMISQVSSGATFGDRGGTPGSCSFPLPVVPSARMAHGLDDPVALWKRINICICICIWCIWRYMLYYIIYHIWYVKYIYVMTPTKFFSPIFRMYTGPPLPLWSRGQKTHLSC